MQLPIALYACLTDYGDCISAGDLGSFDDACDMVAEAAEKDGRESVVMRLDFSTGLMTDVTKDALERIRRRFRQRFPYDEMAEWLRPEVAA